jgi:hypothetical protein
MANHRCCTVAAGIEGEENHSNAANDILQRDVIHVRSDAAVGGVVAADTAAAGIAPVEILRSAATTDAHLAFRHGALASQSPAMIEPYGITSSITYPRPYFAICDRTDAAFL